MKSSSASSRSAKTVLVVDDDPRYVKLMKENLEGEGYHVVCGNDGQMALDQAETHVPDLILMDVAMPTTNGLRTFELLRRNPRTQSIPVIFISEMVSQVITPVVDSAPRVGHLKKPADLEDINSIVRDFLQRYPSDRHEETR